VQHEQGQTTNFSPFFISLISSAFINYHLQYPDILQEHYFSSVIRFQAEIGQRPLPLPKMTQNGQDAFIKSLLKCCESRPDYQLASILRATPIEPSILTRLLFSLRSFDTWTSYSSLVCYFCSVFSDHQLKDVLSQALALWSDPIIAKVGVLRDSHYLFSTPYREFE
jgi:hypothetical protein